MASYFYFIRDVERSVVSKIKRGTFAGYDISLPILELGNTMADATADGFGMMIEKDPKKKQKRAAGFIDNFLTVMSMLTGIPYRTPKKIITGGGKRRERAGVTPAFKAPKFKTPSFRTPAFKAPRFTGGF